MSGGHAQVTSENSNIGGGGKGWRLSYSVPKEEMQSVAMPEPQHRIGPAGVSSGISLRELPKAKLEDLPKICQHYEAKCGGVYSSDSAAARYLFQLSREVQHVAASLAQESTGRTRASTEAENILAEWKEVFGPDSPLVREVSSLGFSLSGASGERGGGGAIDEKDDDDVGGSPRADGGLGAGDVCGIENGVSPGKIAEALRYLARRVGDAERGKDAAARERESDAAEFRGVLEQHVAASVASSEADRRMHQSNQAASADERGKMLETLREQHDQAIQQILVEKDVEFNKMAEGYKKQLNEVQLALLNNRQHMINTEVQWRKRVEELEQRERAELTRMREQYAEQITRAKTEAAAAHAALGGAGISSTAEGVRRGVGGTRGAPGLGGVAQGHDGGIGGGDGGGGAREDDARVRSLTLLLDESKKECRWARERNQELERVVEALRKTIMRQAELSTQRQDQQQQQPQQQQQLQGQQRPPAHAFRGRPQQPQQYHQQQQHQQTAISNSRELGSNDDLLLQQRHGGIGLSRGHSEDMLTHGGGVSGVGPRGVGKASMRGGANVGRGMPGGRAHSHQVQYQTADTLPYRRYTTHYDDPTTSLEVGSSNNSKPMRQQHQHQHGLPSFSRADLNRDLPDRSWSQSAPLPDQTPRGGGGGSSVLGHGSGAMGLGAGLIGGGAVAEGGVTEFAAPVPRHHHSGRQGSLHGPSSGALAAPAAASTLPGDGGGGGFSSSQWDREPARNTMAFATMKYPPGTFPSGGVYGEGALFEQVQRPQAVDGKRNTSVNSARALGVGGGGGRAAGEMGRAGSGSDLVEQMRHSQSQGLIGDGHRSKGGLMGHERSPALSGGGTPGPPPGLTNAPQGVFSPSIGSGMISATSSPSLLHMGASREARHGSGRGGRGSGIGASQKGETPGDLDFDFGELDTSAVLGL